MSYEGPGSQEFQTLIEHEEDIMWAKADLLAVIRRDHGEGPIKEIAKDHRLTRHNLLLAARVASAIPDGERDPKLSYSHHRVAYQAGDWQKWIRLASENDWSLRDLRDAIEIEKGIDPEAAARKAGTGARQIKTAADQTEGTPAFDTVAARAREAFDYVAHKQVAKEEVASE